MYSERFEDLPASVVDRKIKDRQSLANSETEDFLRSLSSDLSQERHQLWHRDYSSEKAYVRSVAANRERWRQAVGDPSSVTLPPAEGEIEWEPFIEDEEVTARWISLPVSGGLRARAIFAVPKGQSGPLPLVVAQHGVTSSPEKVMGFADPGGAYKGYGRELVRAGYAVLAPSHIAGRPARARLQRMGILIGFTLWGLEIYKLHRLLDEVLTYSEVDENRVGMWGLSLGGAYTMFAIPLELRIRVGISAAWFDHRYRKMLIDDGRYNFSFLSTEAEHIFIPRWLAEFHDDDLASLICPRPLQIQHGKGDRISWWPMVVEAFTAAQRHYEALGRKDALELDLAESGHEVHVQAGLRFLQKWL